MSGMDWVVLGVKFLSVLVVLGIATLVGVLVTAIIEIVRYDVVTGWRDRGVRPRRYHGSRPGSDGRHRR